MHKLTKGSISEAKILAAFVAGGYAVSIPWSQNSRYDMVVDHNNQLYRVQCKTAWLIQDGAALKFNTRSCNATITPKDYRGQVEFFAVYSPDFDKVYVIPIEEATKTACTLRLTHPQNNQMTRVRMASDYEFNPSVTQW